MFLCFNILHQTRVKLFHLENLSFGAEGLYFSFIGTCVVLAIPEDSHIIILFHFTVYQTQVYSQWSVLSHLPTSATWRSIFPFVKTNKGSFVFIPVLCLYSPRTFGYVHHFYSHDYLSICFNHKYLSLIKQNVYIIMFHYSMFWLIHQWI